MPRTRSRPKTEEKFEKAVLNLVANEGCCALGVNAVAQEAGADKVLIYRYFGDLNGLLLRVAHSRPWLPSASEVLNALSFENARASHLLHEIFRLLVHHIKADKTTHQLVRWRKADKNPLTDFFSEEWRKLWRDLPDYFSVGLGGEMHNGWHRACGLLALMIEAELCEEGVPQLCIDQFSETLESGVIAPVSNSESDSKYNSGRDADDDLNDSDGDTLPTNLL